MNKSVIYSLLVLCSLSLSSCFSCFVTVGIRRLASTGVENSTFSFYARGTCFYFLILSSLLLFLFKDVCVRRFPVKVLELSRGMKINAALKAADLIGTLH